MQIDKHLARKQNQDMHNYPFAYIIHSLVWIIYFHLLEPFLWFFCCQLSNFHTKFSD